MQQCIRTLDGVKIVTLVYENTENVFMKQNSSFLPSMRGTHDVALSLFLSKSIMWHRSQLCHSFL